MSRDDAWMPFYIGDYLRDTGHLSVAEHGAYMLLLMQAWTRDGALPAEDERLRSLARATPKEWKQWRATLLAFFSREGDTYRHKRVDKELATAKAMIEQRRAAGKASAEARKRQRDGGDDGNGGGNGNPTGGQRSFNGTPTETARAFQRNGRPSPSPSKFKNSLGEECAGTASSLTGRVIRDVAKSLKTQPPPFTPSRHVQLSALTLVSEAKSPVEPIRTPEEQLAILRGEAAA